MKYFGLLLCAVENPILINRLSTFANKDVLIKEIDQKVQQFLDIREGLDADPPPTDNLVRFVPRSNL